MTHSSKDIEQQEERPEIRNLIMLTQALIDRRKGLGWSQEKLAKKAGTTQPVVARIENAVTASRIDTYIKLANAMGMKVMLEEEEELE